MCRGPLQEVPEALSGLVVGPLLGRGANGSVYRGRMGEDIVAVKVMMGAQDWLGGWPAGTLPWCACRWRLAPVGPRLVHPMCPLCPTLLSPAYGDSPQLNKLKQTLLSYAPLPHRRADYRLLCGGRSADHAAPARPAASPRGHAEVCVPRLGTQPGQARHRACTERSRRARRCLKPAMTCTAPRPAAPLLCSGLPLIAKPYHLPPNPPPTPPLPLQPKPGQAQQHRSNLEVCCEVH